MGRHPSKYSEGRWKRNKFECGGALQWLEPILAHKALVCVIKHRSTLGRADVPHGGGVVGAESPRVASDRGDPAILATALTGDIGHTRGSWRKAMAERLRMVVALRRRSL